MAPISRRIVFDLITLRTLAGVSGSLLAALSVACGAFAAHALRTTLEPGSLALWQTAVHYQFIHALALLVVAAFSGSPSRLAEKVAVIAFLCGVVLFSGSLYALALGATHGIGVITPVGGAAFLIGWIALAVTFLRKSA